MTLAPWRLILYPLAREDVLRIGRHVAEATGASEPGRRPVIEADALIEAVGLDPLLGAPLEGALQGRGQRHGGRNRLLTAIYRADEPCRIVRLHLVAFGGANRSGPAAAREAIDRS